MFKQIRKYDYLDYLYYKHKIFEYNIGRTAWYMAWNGQMTALKFFEYKINYV